METYPKFKYDSPFVTTSSTNFGVLVYVIGSLDPFINDPSSYTIFLPNSNSNGNPFADSSLGGAYSFVGLNSSKVGCVTTFSIFSSIACIPSYVCYYCYCKCCSKCYKCCELAMVSIQFSHTSLSMCKCSSPSGNLISCSLLTP